MTTLRIDSDEVLTGERPGAFRADRRNGRL